MAKNKESKQSAQKRIRQQKQQSLILNHQRQRKQKYQEQILASSLIEEKSPPLTPLQQKIGKLFSCFDYLVQCFYVGFIITVWWFPEKFSITTIYNLTVVFIFEFILVHSGLFMIFLARTKLIWFLIPAYGLFAFIINRNIMGDDNIVLWIYAVVVANRLIGNYQVKDIESFHKNVFISAMMVLNFMFCIFFVVLLRFLVPYGGLTPQYLAEIDYLYIIKSNSEYFDTPHVGMAYGTLFYGIPLVCTAVIYLLPIYKKTILRFKARKMRKYRGLPRK